MLRKRTGQSNNAVTTDRGYGSKDNEAMAKAAGVKKIAIPKKGKKSKERTELEKSRNEQINKGFWAK